MATIAAQDGPAKGFISSNIDVEESNATLVGHSLQLIGTGNVYADFTWGGPTNHTRGAVNGEQVFKAIPTLFILK